MLYRKFNFSGAGRDGKESFEASEGISYLTNDEHAKRTEIYLLARRNLLLCSRLHSLCLMTEINGEAAIYDLSRAYLRHKLISRVVVVATEALMSRSRESF